MTVLTGGDGGRVDVMEWMDVMERSHGNDQTPNAPPRRRWPLTLKILLTLYAAWLGWLVYVAWVNVQSGNV